LCFIFNGEIEINTEINKGTEINIMIPKENNLIG